MISEWKTKGICFLIVHRENYLTVVLSDAFLNQKNNYKAKINLFLKKFENMGSCGRALFLRLFVKLNWVVLTNFSFDSPKKDKSSV